MEQLWQLNAPSDGRRAFSPDGRLFAIPNKLGEIEVWDVATGTRREVISDAPRRWAWWSAALFGGIAWCAAWLVTGWRTRNTCWRCADIAIVSAVALVGFFLRLTMGGVPLQLQRPAAIATLVLLVGLSQLLACWLALGAGRWSWRLSVFIASLAALWAGPLWTYQHFQWSRGELAIGSIASAVFTALLLVATRRIGCGVVRTGDSSATAHGHGHSLQIPLRDLLLLPVALGLMLLTAKIVPITPALPSFMVLGITIVGGTVSLITVLSVWVALSPCGALVRFLIGLGGILGLSLWLPAAVPQYEASWLCFILQAAIGIYVVCALSLLRGLGWRLVKLPRAVASQ